MSENLTLKQRLFVDAYVGVAKGNATEAARLAGYEGDDATLRSVGSQNLTKLNIKAAISERVSEFALSPEAVLAGIKELTEARLSDLVEGAIYGKPTIQLFEKDPDNPGQLRPKAAAAHLKKITVTDDSVGIELYSRFAALVQLGKYHKLWTDKVEHTGKDGEPLFKTYEDVDTDQV